MKIIYDDFKWAEGYFKEGVMHGFMRHFDETGRLTWVGNYRNGMTKKRQRVTLEENNEIIDRFKFRRAVRYLLENHQGRWMRGRSRGRDRSSDRNPSRISLSGLQNGPRRNLFGRDFRIRSGTRALSRKIRQNKLFAINND